MGRMRPLLAVAVSAAVLLPVAPADAMPVPMRSAGAASAGVTAAGTASVAASARGGTGAAPAVPGARRFTGRIPAYVTQVIVVSAPTWRSTAGTVVAYERRGSGWHRVRAMTARLGYSGLVPAASRRQSTGKTPAGQFRITETFGRSPDPGTAMPFTRLRDDHWWVQDRRSRYYNQMRLGSRGGFALRRKGFNSSEQLARMGAQYDYAAVIDFNRPRPVIGRGSGIFLHAYGDRTTVGCVSVPRAQMRAVLRWLDPAAHPRIVIGEHSWLAAPMPR